MQFIADVRGYRNCNPGNLRHGPKWKGLRELQTDKDFAQFVSPEFGIRAIRKTLETYQKKYGLKTPSQLLNRYAPTSENDTAAYVKHVCSLMLVKSYDPIDVFNKYMCTHLVEAIITHELGVNPYSDIIIERGFLIP
jgi:hypothetical protein